MPKPRSVHIPRVLVTLAAHSADALCACVCACAKRGIRVTFAGHTRWTGSVGRSKESKGREEAAFLHAIVGVAKRNNAQF